MYVHGQSLGSLTDNYPQEHTLYLPPKAIARLGRGGVSDIITSPDGTIVAVLSRIGVWLYGAHTDDFIALIAVEETGVLGKIAFSPDGTQIAVGDWDGKTTLWDVETGAILNAFTHQAEVRTLTFSPDGRFLAIGSEDGMANLWNVEKGTVRATMPHEDWVVNIAVSPDGCLLATGNRNGTVTLWDVETETICFTVPHKKGWMTDIALSPDGRFLVTGSQDRRATLWDIETGEDYWAVTCKSTVQSIAFSPDNRYVAMRLKSGIVDIRSVDDGARAPAAIQKEQWITTNRRNPPAQHSREHFNWMVTFSPDGRHLAGLDGAHSLTLWDVETGEKTRTLEKVTEHDVAMTIFQGRTVVCSSQGHYLVIGFGGTKQDTVRLWNEGTIVNFSPETPVISATVSPDGRLLATGGWDRTITLWNVETQGVYCTLKGHTGEIRALAFSNDGKLLVSGGANNWQEYQESADGNLDLPEGNRVVLVKDGVVHYFYTDENCIDKTAKVWEVATGKNIATLETPSQVREVTFSHDGTNLAVASERHVSLWCTKTWQNIATLDVKKVESLAFSPDGTRLATGGTWPEQTIRLWDVETGERIADFPGHKSNVASLAFSPDGTLLASGSFDGTILLWDMKPYL